MMLLQSALRARCAQEFRCISRAPGTGLQLSYRPSDLDVPEGRTPLSCRLLRLSQALCSQSVVGLRKEQLSAKNASSPVSAGLQSNSPIGAGR